MDFKLPWQPIEILCNSSIPFKKENHNQTIRNNDKKKKWKKTEKKEHLESKSLKNKSDLDKGVMLR